MKRIFLFLSVLILSAGVVQSQQIKISQLPTLTGDPTGGFLPIVKGGLTQKVDARFLGYNKIDSVSITLGTGIDTFKYWRNGNVAFYNTYTPSGGGGGGGSGTLSGLSDVSLSGITSNQALVYSLGRWRNATLNTSIISEGSNLYWLNSRFDTRFALKTTDSLPQGTTNKYFTTAASRLSISVFGPPLTYNNTTGVIGVTQATLSTAGYLTALDWNTFNNKFNTPSGTASQYVRGDGVIVNFPSFTTTYAALTDVNLTSLADGQLVKYSASSGKWVNFTANYLTGITNSQVTTALGFTPLNPNGLVTQYVRGNGTFATTDTSMIPSFYTKVRSQFTAGTGISLTNGLISNSITDLSQLTNTPGYITGVSGGNIITALGYTPANQATTITINGIAFDLSQNRSWSVAGALAGLTDVNFTSISDGQLTKYNAGTGKWINFTPTYISSVDTSSIPSFSVKVRGLFSAGTGLTYNSSTGLFTNAITNTNQLTNGAGFITNVSNTQVIAALGFNPVSPTTTITINGITNNLSANSSYSLPYSTLTDVNITSLADGQLMKYNAGSSKWVNFTPGYLTSISSSNVTTALGFTPIAPADTSAMLNTYLRKTLAASTYLTPAQAAAAYYPLSANPSNYLTSINSSQVTTALGFTPINPTGTTAQYVRGDGSFSSFMFNNLTDVAVVSPSNGQLMRYNTSTSKWNNFTPTYFLPTDTLTTLATKTNIVKDTVIGFQIGDGGSLTPSNGTTTYSNTLLVAAQVVNVFKGDSVLPTFAVTGGKPYVTVNNTTGVLTLHNTTFLTGQAVAIQYAFGSGVVPGGGGGGGGAVSSVFGRAGAVIAQLGDYSSFYYQIPTGTTSQYIRGDGSFSTFPTFATVATTGAYTDLTGKPVIPTNTNQLTNGAGFLTSITGSQVTTALGYTPLNPNGTSLQYIRGDGTLATSDTTMIPNFYAKVRAEHTAGTGISISAAGVIANTITNTNQLTNGSGFLTSISSGNVTSALGYTPANAATTLTINGTVFDLSANRSYTLNYSNLADVNLTTITDGQLVKWNNSTSKWINFTPTYLTTVDTGNIANFYAKVRSLTTAGSGIGITNGIVTNLITNTNQLTNGAGFISGNQTITLTGAVTGSGTTAITTAFGSNAISYSNFQQVGANKILGNTTGSTANVAEIPLGVGLGFSAGSLINTITNTNQLTNGAGFLTSITSGNVTTALGYTPMINAGLGKSWASGVYSSRPSAGNAGAFYLATDSNRISYDNGTAWKWITDTASIKLFQSGAGINPLYSSLLGDTLKQKGFVGGTGIGITRNSDSSLTWASTLTGSNSVTLTGSSFSLTNDVSSGTLKLYGFDAASTRNFITFSSLPSTIGTTNGLFPYQEKNRLDSQFYFINIPSSFGGDSAAFANGDTVFYKRILNTAGWGVAIANNTTQNIIASTYSVDTTAGKVASQYYVNARTLFTQTANKTVANTASATTLLNTGVGSLTLPANYLTTGKTLKLHIGGVYSTPASGSSAIITVKLGGVMIASGTASALLGSATNAGFSGDITITHQGSGVLYVDGGLNYSLGNNLARATLDLNNAGSSSTVTITNSLVLDVTVTWDSATTTRSITTTIFTVEALN